MTDATPLVTGVDFVSVPTQDLEKAMEFYGEVLGLPRSAVWHPPGRDPVGAEFETGTVTIAIQVSELMGIDFEPHKLPIALHVEDVEAAAPRLRPRASSSSARRSTAASATRRSSAIPTAICSTSTTATPRSTARRTGRGGPTTSPRCARWRSALGP